MSTLPRRSATAPAAASAPRPSSGSTATTIGIRDVRHVAPGIGTGVKGAKPEQQAAPAVDSSAASSPDLVLTRLVPVPSPSHSAARGVMAYAAQAAARAAAKSAVAAPAALIEVA